MGSNSNLKGGEIPLLFLGGDNMEVSDYIWVSEPRLKDGKMWVTARVKRWRMFSFVWVFMKENVKLPWYKWYAFYIYLTLKYTILGFPDYTRGE